MKTRTSRFLYAVLIAFTLLDGRTALAGLPGGIPGITEPRHDILLSAAVAGRVDAIHHREGSEVEAGEILVSLDRRMEELEVERRKLLMESSVELVAAEKQLEVLAANLEASRRLFQTTGSVSRERLSQIELEFEMARAERDRILENRAREKIEYEMALEQLARREIRAPFRGVVSEVFLDLGEACEPRQPVLRLIDPALVFFVSNVSPSLIENLKEGSFVKVVIGEIGAGQEVVGKVEHLSPVVDPASGLRRIKVLIDNSDRRITPGSLGRLDPTPLACLAGQDSTDQP